MLYGFSPRYAPRLDSAGSGLARCPYWSNRGASPTRRVVGPWPLVARFTAVKGRAVEASVVGWAPKLVEQSGDEPA